MLSVPAGDDVLDVRRILHLASDHCALLHRIMYRIPRHINGPYMFVVYVVIVPILEYDSYCNLVQDRTWRLILALSAVSDRIKQL